MFAEIKVNENWITIEEHLTFAQHIEEAKKLGATEVRSLDGRMHTFLNVEPRHAWDIEDDDGELIGVYTGTLREAFAAAAESNGRVRENPKVCPYCHTPVVRNSKAINGISPISSAGCTFCNEQGKE